MKPYSDINDPRLIKALAHPLRVRILSVLETRELASPNELADELERLARRDELPRAPPARARLPRARQAHAPPRRDRAPLPREGAPARHRRRMGRDPGIVKRAMVGATLQQITGYVNAAAARGGFDRAEAHLSRTVLMLDDEGWEELAAEMASGSRRSSSSRPKAASASKPPGGDGRERGEAQRCGDDAVRDRRRARGRPGCATPATTAISAAAPRVVRARCAPSRDGRAAAGASQASTSYTRGPLRM